jgi:hypothetical protein
MNPTSKKTQRESLAGFCILIFLIAVFFKSFLVPLLLVPIAGLWFYFTAFRKSLAVFWVGLARWLSAITNPIVLGLIFFVVVTPYGFLYRLFKGDTLKLRRKLYASLWTKKAHKYSITDYESPF